MTRRVHPVVVTLAVIVVLAVVTMVYVRRTEVPEPLTPSPLLGIRSAGQMRAHAQRGRGMAQQTSPGNWSDQVLGIEIAADPEKRGVRLVRYLPPEDFSPLNALGVKPGDVIVSCNGKERELRSAMLTALQDLQERGDPITLKIHRGDKQITLHRAEKLPPPQRRPKGAGQAGARPDR